MNILKSSLSSILIPLSLPLQRRWHLSLSLFSLFLSLSSSLLAAAAASLISLPQLSSLQLSFSLFPILSL